MSAQGDTSAAQPSDPKGVTGKLCNWISSLQYEAIPENILTRARYLILDGIACGLVGAHLPWSTIAAKGIMEMEPEGKCTVIGWGGKKISPTAASVLNGTFIQGFELDDYHSRAPLHSNSLLLPALFATVEHTHDARGGNVVDGKEFLKAYVIGCEIGPRVGLALHGGDLLTRGWHSGAIQGPSAVAAAVGTLLGLSPAEQEWAQGIACTQTGGLMSAQFGSMAKRMQHGLASRNGLFGAMMAKVGYTGIENVYETPYGGFLSCFGQGANFEPKTLPEELIADLGERWELEGVRVKLHAAMAALHGTIDCLETLQHEHPEKVSPERIADIKHIKTEHGRAAYEHGGWIAPVDKPISSMGAQMSVQYAAAAQFLDRQVLMVQFDTENLNRPEIREFMNKVHPEHNKDFDADKEDTFRTRVTITFNDGTEVTQELKAFRGIDPPCSNEDIVDKWRKLVDGILEKERMAAIEKCVLSMHTLDDVKDLTQLLEGTVRCPIKI